MMPYIRPRMAFVLICLAVLGLVVYWNVLSFPFVHDDIIFIRNNPSIARWDNILDAFLHPGTPFNSGSVTTPYYRPVLECIYRLEYHLFGMNPGGFHLFNILLHLLNSVLVFGFARSLGTGRWLALAAAVIFCVHPVQSEAVACVSGISNLVVALFLLAGFLLYARARKTKGYGRRGLLTASGFVYLLALLSKEQALMFPVWIVGYEFLMKRPSERWSSIGGRVAVPAGLALAFLVWRTYLFPGYGAHALENAGELGLRLMAIPGILVMDAGLCVFPVGLHYYRSVDILAPAWPGWVMAVALAVFLWQIRRRLEPGARLVFSLGLLWALVFIVPGLNILPLINEYSMVLAAEHFLYLVLAGMMVSVLVFLRWLGQKVKHTVSVGMQIVLGVVIVVCLASATVRQNTFWRGEIPLFERTLVFEPGLGRVHALLAVAYADQGRHVESLSEFSTALNIMQDYVKKSGQSKARGVYEAYLKMIRFNRGQVYTLMGRAREAMEEFRQALGVRVEGIRMEELDVNDGMILNAAARLLVQENDVAGAVHLWKRAAVMDSRNAEAFNNLGVAAREARDVVRARFFFRKSLEAVPGFPPALANMKQMEGK